MKKQENEILAIAGGRGYNMVESGGEEKGDNGPKLNPFVKQACCCCPAHSSCRAGAQSEPEGGVLTSVGWVREVEAHTLREALGQSRLRSSW